MDTTALLTAPSLSFEMAETPDLRRPLREVYPPYVVKLVLKLRAASYTEGGTDLASLFGKLDADNSGSLDYDEFKQVIRRWVCA